MVFNNDDPKKVMVALRRIILTSGASDQGLIFASRIGNDGNDTSHSRGSGDLAMVASLRDSRFRGNDGEYGGNDWVV